MTGVIISNAFIDWSHHVVFSDTITDHRSIFVLNCQNGGGAPALVFGILRGRIEAMRDEWQGYDVHAYVWTFDQQASQNHGASADEGVAFHEADRDRLALVVCERLQS